MKKIALRCLQVLAVVAVAGGLYALSIHLGGLPKYRPEDPPVKALTSTQDLERGKRLVSLLCIDCHENPQTHRLTGRHLSDLPKAFGEIYSKNITRHPTQGIGSWSDGQLVYFLRTGVRPDGQYVPPWMAKFPHLSDQDLLSVIGFLRSDDPIIAASDEAPPGVTQPSFLSKVLARTVFSPLPYPTEPIQAPPRADRVAYGRYLTFALDCYSCHSPDFKTMNVLEPEKTPGFLSGSNPLVDGAGEAILSANLTPDEETGIGGWNEQEFIRAVVSGVRPDGRVLHYPMLPKTGLEAEEAGAIYAYLRTVPRIHNPVQRPAVTLASTGVQSGEALFKSYGCVSCHGAAGVGPLGDLRTANEHFPSDLALRQWIDEAPRLRPGTRMPAWKGIIREEDYPALLDHVRTLARPEQHARK